MKGRRTAYRGNRVAMNKRIIFLIVAGVIAVGAVVVLVAINRSAPVMTEVESPATGPSKAGVAKPATVQLWALPPAREATKLAPMPPEMVYMKDEEGSVTGQGVRLVAGKVLATVNRIPLTMADLMPLGGGQMEVTMDVEEYQKRLEMAVEAELTLQAARSRGIGLDEAQQKRVIDIRQRQAKAFEQLQREGISWTSVTAEQVAFEERQAAVVMLQINMVQKQSGVAPSSDSDAQQKYEEMLRAMLAQMKAGAEIVVKKPVEMATNK